MPSIKQFYFYNKNIYIVHNDKGPLWQTIIREQTRKSFDVFISKNVQYKILPDFKDFFTDTRECWVYLTATPEREDKVRWGYDLIYSKKYDDLESNAELILRGKDASFIGLNVDHYDLIFKYIKTSDDIRLLRLVWSKKHGIVEFGD